MNETARSQWLNDGNAYQPIPYSYWNEADQCWDVGHMPSLAQQWKEDMARMVATLKKHEDLTSDHFRFRAPEEFIKTGRWPEGVERPVTMSVAYQKEMTDDR